MSYWDKTEYERSQLTEEEVDQFTKLALMEEGIVTPKEPDYVPVPEDPEIQSVEYWQLTEKGAESWRSPEACSCLFKTQEDAQRALDFFQESGVKRETDYATETVCAKPLLKLEIQNVTAWPAEVVELKRSILEKVKEAKETNEKLRSAYSEELKKCREAVSKIYEDWHSCQDQVREHRRITEVFDEYLVTIGDVPDREQIALKFLAKAYTQEQIAEAAEWNDDLRLVAKTHGVVEAAE